MNLEKKSKEKVKEKAKYFVGDIVLVTIENSEVESPAKVISVTSQKIEGKQKFICNLSLFYPF